jgi:hypothetical protein
MIEAMEKFATCSPANINSADQRLDWLADVRQFRVEKLPLRFMLTKMTIIYVI